MGGHALLPWIFLIQGVKAASVVSPVLEVDSLPLSHQLLLLLLLLSRFSRIRLLATPWTAAYQAPLSVGFARQEYWSGLPLPTQL